MRDRIAERVMLAEIHLRNLIARFKDLNEQEYKVAAIPEVGIFWMSKDGKKFYKKSVSVRDAENYGDFKIMDTPHYSEWSSATRKVPSWQGKEYEEIPRGRVVLSVNPGNNRFVVFLPKELKRFAKKISAAFKIPSAVVEFDYSDIHYKMDRSFLDDEDW